LGDISLADRAEGWTRAHQDGCEYEDSTVVYNGGDVTVGFNIYAGWIRLVDRSGEMLREQG
jgi:hypothetical protein